MEKEIKCPVCGCEEVFASKKGFNAKKAVAGAILTGDALISALAGSAGSNKVEITCLRCGHKFYPGDPLSVKHEPLMDKRDLPQTAYYKCSCGKVSSLETANPYCPACGRRLTDNEIISEDTAKEQSKKGGCLGVILIPFLVLVSILMML